MEGTQKAFEIFVKIDSIERFVKESKYQMEDGFMMEIVKESKDQMEDDFMMEIVKDIQGLRRYVWGKDIQELRRYVWGYATYQTLLHGYREGYIDGGKFETMRKLFQV